MSKVLIASLSILLIIATTTAAPDNFYGGTLLMCNSDDGCWHEIGHKMDEELGLPSHTEEFGNALRVYLIFSAMYNIQDEYALKILGFGGILQYSPEYQFGGSEVFSSPQSELYADMYMMSGGNINKIPEIFRKFYSSDPKYTNLFNCLKTEQVCGKSWRK